MWNTFALELLHGLVPPSVPFELMLEFIYCFVDGSDTALLVFWEDDSVEDLECLSRNVAPVFGDGLLTM